MPLYCYRVYTQVHDAGYFRSFAFTLISLLPGRCARSLRALFSWSLTQWPNTRTWVHLHCFSNDVTGTNTNASALNSVLLSHSFLLAFMNLSLTSSVARYSLLPLLSSARLILIATDASVSSGMYCFCLFVCFQATMLFAELTYTLATEEAERIGVDHVARMTATGTGENSTGKTSCCLKNYLYMFY